MPSKIDQVSWPNVGHRMHTARLVLGLTDCEVAEALGVTLGTFEVSGRRHV